MRMGRKNSAHISSVYSKRQLRRSGVEWKSFPFVLLPPKKGREEGAKQGIFSSKAQLSVFDATWCIQK